MRASLRWNIAILISAAIAISYFDRQTLPVAIAAIQRDIPISNTEFSELQAAFLIAYAVMYVGGGKLIDALGTRRGFLVVMLWWLLACASHGLALSLAMLAASRFMLGLGEGSGFPAATKAVAEWFPVEERSAAMGIMNAGTAVGAVIAPPAITLILSALNWRWVFFCSGLAGLAWVLWWIKEYFPPAQHQRLTAEERGQIGEVLALHRDDGSPASPWLRLITFPQVWGLVLAKFLSDAAWYFYLFWLPKYLYDARGFDIKRVGQLLTTVYSAGEHRHARQFGG